jgi:hypothetical protein
MIGLRWPLSCRDRQSRAAYGAPPQRCKPLNDNTDPGTPGTRQRKPKIGGLSSLGDLRHEVACLYRSARRGDVEAGDASKLASVLALLARLVEGSDFDERLAEVERRLAEATGRVVAEGRRCR